eukprot:3052732-Pyramimonas_sp.AAC.1
MVRRSGSGLRQGRLATQAVYRARRPRRGIWHFRRGRDQCTDQYRTNAHCAHSWYATDDCTKQNWGGLHVFCNGLFSLLFDILSHFVECKQRHPVGTAALVIVPLWPTEKFWQYAMSLPQVFKVVRRWPKGSEMFTAPIPANKGGGRRECGPTRWPVVALRVDPGAIEPKKRPNAKARKKDTTNKRKIRETNPTQIM